LATKALRVGDAVHVSPENATPSQPGVVFVGTIVEARGRGWYRVKIGEPNIVVLRRSTQLRATTVDGTTTPTPPPPPAAAAAAAAVVVPKRMEMAAVPGAMDTAAAEPTTTTTTATTTTAATTSAFFNGAENDTLPPIHPPPPLTIYDLDALLLQQQPPPQGDPSVQQPHSEYLEQVAYFQTVPHWVVFTDLHVSPATLGTCLLVPRPSSATPT
jgi:hypothetical protein